MESYNLSVAHGIHSINVEQLNYYFDGNVEEDNDIPTTNSDLSSEEGVLPSAPKINKDNSILTPSMMMLDYIMSNNDDIDTFLIKVPLSFPSHKRSKGTSSFQQTRSQP